MVELMGPGVRETCSQSSWFTGLRFRDLGCKRLSERVSAGTLVPASVRDRTWAPYPKTSPHGVHSYTLTVVAQELNVWECGVGGVWDCFFGKVICGFAH